MPIMIVNEEEWQREVKHNTSDHGDSTVPSEDIIIENKIEIIDQKEGRGNVPNVPEELRMLVGEEYSLFGRTSGNRLAELLKVSNTSASAYAHGSTSTASYNNTDKKIVKHINNAKDRIIGKAQNKLMSALEAIDEEKLKNIKAVDASAIAKDMSAIIKNMEPEQENNKNINNGPIFQIYCPPTKNEDYFETIVVAE